MNLKTIKQIKPGKGLLIEGLPGIGNVGKIAADYMIEALKAEKVAEISSNEFPNLVVVNEDNLVELPLITIWYKKLKEKELYFVIGDFQPSTEAGSFQLAEKIIGYSKKQGIKEIITLGGIGLEAEKDDPEVYVTGNNKKSQQKFKKSGAKIDTYGKVSTIIGVTGLLLGMTKIPASALLVETTFEPGISAITSAKKLVQIIKKNYGIKISLKELDNDFVELENKHLKEVEKMEKTSKIEETNYIG